MTELAIDTSRIFEPLLEAYVYDVKNGQRVEVPEGTRVGQTR
jgi:hypothetical protein